MKRFTVIIVLLILSSYSFCQSDSIILDSFKPTQIYYSLDSNSYMVGIELGTLNMYLKIESSKYNNERNKIKLSGTIYYEEIYTLDTCIHNRAMGAIPFVKIFKAKQQYNDDLIDIVELGMTDLYGYFSIKTKLKNDEIVYFQSVGFVIYHLDLINEK